MLVFFFENSSSYQHRFVSLVMIYVLKKYLTPCMMLWRSSFQPVLLFCVLPRSVFDGLVIGVNT